MKTICGLCDGVYDTAHADDVHAHQHPEPQSGPERTAWLASGLPWSEYERREKARTACQSGYEVDIEVLVEEGG